MSVNPFGGKNPHGLYVPMSETELEALDRVVHSGDLVLKVFGQKIPQFRIEHGDLRVRIVFDVAFDLEKPTTVYYLDLELSYKGLVLKTDRKSTLVNNEPLMLGPGLSITFVWDIAIHHMDPNFVKVVLPGAIGLTSRRIDKDTHNATLIGNMRADEKQKRILHQLKESEKVVRKVDHRELSIAKTLEAKGSGKAPTDL